MPQWDVRVHVTSLCHVSCVIMYPAPVIMSLTAREFRPRSMPHISEFKSFSSAPG